MEKAFSPEAKAEAVARFARAMNREDIDGFVFCVSCHGGISNCIVWSEPIIAYMLSDIFVDSELDTKIFLEAVLVNKLLQRGRKEEDND